MNRSCHHPIVVKGGLKRHRVRRLALMIEWATVLVGAMALAIVPAQVRSGIDDKDRSSAPFGDEPITPIPLTTNLDPAKVRLGERLFHDVRLSHDNILACATCHRLAEGGDDGLALSRGWGGKQLGFNSPTVFNATLRFRLNWRGNFRSLDALIEAVLLNPRLMNTSWDELLSKLRADADYRKAFGAIDPGGPKPAHVLDAIAAYHRSLLTPNARFDQYLRGQRDAITDEEKRGYHLFKSYGCIACHQGVNVGGNLFQKFGVFQDPLSSEESVTEADLGRFTITHDDQDRHVFRVPSLRNVAVTAPYFHDGRTPTLEQAVGIMAKAQLGRILSRQDIGLIVQFLHTLTGEYQGRSLASQANGSPQ
jgi:cytochrome c peroxidase